MLQSLAFLEYIYMAISPIGNIKNADSFNIHLSKF